MNEPRVDFIGSTWFFLLGGGALCFLLVLLVVTAVFLVVWLSKRQAGPRDRADDRQWNKP